MYPVRYCHSVVQLPADTHVHSQSVLNSTVLSPVKPQCGKKKTNRKRKQQEKYSVNIVPWGTDKQEITITEYHIPKVMSLDRDVIFYLYYYLEFRAAQNCWSTCSSHSPFHNHLCTIVGDPILHMDGHKLACQSYINKHSRFRIYVGWWFQFQEFCC